MEPVLPEIKCIKFLKIIAKYPEYREFRKKHWHRQIRTFPEYLRCNISKISDRFMGIIRGQRDIFRRMLRWGIRGLMAFLVILIICYLIALAILALGKLIEPVVGPILAVEKLVELVVGPIFAIGKLIEPVINPIMPSSDNIPPIVNSIKSALNSVWISFGDIDYKNSDITSIIEILAGLLVAILLTSIFKEDESLLVLPFNVKLEGAKSEEVILSGKFVQDQFIANLNKILWTHSTKHERILPETIHTENETLPKLNPLNESLTYNLAELGTISAGPFGLSIGQILLMLKQLCPLAKPGTIIKGSVYQCGSEISLVATIGPKGGSNESPSWDIRRSFKGKTIEHEKILDLIRDLAYQVAYKFISDSPPKNWAAFKYFTEALYAYSQ